MNRFIFILTILLFPAFAFSAIVHVPADHETIQAAIDAAGEGASVLVSPGFYVECIDFKGKSITLISSHGPESTVIDGEYPPDSGFKSVVTFQNGEDANARLIGFTITHGAGNMGLGGGIFIHGASPTIEGNIIKDNTVGELGSGTRGGGIYLHDSKAVITGNTIVENKAWFGAGIFSDAADPVVSENLIADNKAAMSGGGIRCEGGHPAFIGNTLRDNMAWDGGGLSCSNSSLHAANNFFHDNQAAKYRMNGRGGGMACTNAYAYLVNNTFHGNSSLGSGGGLALSSSTASVNNSIFWNNTAPSGDEIWIGGESTLSIRYSDVQGGQEAITVLPAYGLEWGFGMIDADPLFADAGPGDFHLLAPSPCRDGGENTMPSLPVEDFEGDPRIDGARVDMGADEFHPHLYVSGDPFTGGGFEIKLIVDPRFGYVHLFLGASVMREPLRSPFGDWYLQFPVVLLAVVEPIPRTGLVLFLGESIEMGAVPDGTNIFPTEFPMQALVGGKGLTNLCVIRAQ